MMKNKILVLLVIFLFTGCYNYREINSLSITTAIGIDKKDDNYLLTIQVVNTQKVGSDTNSTGEQSKFITYETKGETIQEALRKIVLESPRRLYINHLQLIVIGEDLAKEGISQIFDFFMRNPEARKQSQIIVAKESKAEDVLKILTPLETISSKNIVDSISSDSKYLGVSENNTFEYQVKTYLNDRQDIVMSTVKVVGSVDKGENTESLKDVSSDAKVVLQGLAVFKKDKLVGYLTEDESMSANLVNKKVKDTLVNIECGKNKYITIELMKPKVDISPIQDKLQMKIKVNGNGNIKEIDCDYDLNDIKVIQEIEKKTEEKIKQNINSVLNKTINEYKTDIFGFADTIYKSNPKYYKTIKDEWYSKNLENLQIDTKVDFTLKGKGNIITVIPDEEN